MTTNERVPGDARYTFLYYDSGVSRRNDGTDQPPERRPRVLANARKRVPGLKQLPWCELCDQRGHYTRVCPSIREHFSIPPYASCSICGHQWHTTAACTRTRGSAPPSTTTPSPYEASSLRQNLVSRIPRVRTSQTPKP